MTVEPAATPRRGRPRTAGVEERVVAATRALVGSAGYDGTTVDAVAAEAGVAKTAIYRRWASKAMLVYESVLVGGPEAQAIPDTGDVRADLLDVLRQNTAPMRDPAANALVARLLAEAARDPELAEAFRRDHFGPRAGRIADRVTAAVERGELAPTIDPELVPALLTGPMQYLALVYGSALDEAELARVVDAVIGPHLRS